MSVLTAEPDLLPDLEQVRNLREDDVHIACDCRPHVAYCGAYDSTPLVDVDIDGTECPECLEVWKNAACPNCGCMPGQDCRLCATEVSA